MIIDAASGEIYEAARERSSKVTKIRVIHAKNRPATQQKPYDFRRNGCKSHRTFAIITAKSTGLLRERNVSGDHK